MKLQKLSIIELNQYLYSARKVCEEYQKKFGLASGFETNAANKAMNLHEIYRKKYELILNEIIKRLDVLC